MAFSAVDGDGFQVDDGSTTPVGDAVVATAPVGETTAIPTETPATAVDAVPAERNADGTFKAKAATPVEPVKPKKGNPRHDPEARIAQALSEARMEREARIRLEGQLTALQPKADAPTAPKADGKRYREMPGAPKEEAYEQYADYLADLQVFITDTRHDERQVELATRHRAQTTDQQRATRYGGYKAKIDAAIATAPDFLETLSEDILNLQPSDSLPTGTPATVYHALADEIIDADNPVALMQHLSDHPDDFQRLATLPTRRALERALARLDATLTAAAPSTGPARPVAISHAKPPVRPVESSAPVSDRPPGDDASDDEHYAYYSRQMLEARRGRR